MSRTYENSQEPKTQRRLIEELVLLRRRLSGLVGEAGGPTAKREETRIAERHRAIVDSLPDVIVEVDAAACLTYASPRALETFGHQPQELVGRNFAELLHPDCAERAERDLTDVLKSGHTLRREYRARHKDGSDRWVRVSVVVPSEGAGSTAALILTDVTDRVKMEEALRESEEKYRALFGASPESIAIVGLDGSVLDGNGFYGVPRDLVIGRNFREIGILAPEALAYCEGLFAQVSAGQRVGPLELRVSLGQDDERWLEVHGALLKKGEQPFAIQVISRDITDRKNLEAQLLQSQKMEAVGRLAGGVAHDFNNQLSVILNLGEMLERSLSPADPRLDKVRMIRRAAEQSATLTQQLLAFSRRQMVEPAVLDLNQVLTNMETMLARMIGEDIQLQLRLHENLGAVRIDPVQAEQLVINLAVNARDAMPTGGTLVLETANLCVGENPPRGRVSLNPGRYVTLSVTDTGTGMDQETRARIFEPFFTTKGPGEGTGLGLSMVYGVVRQSGGDIDVRSDPDTGTAFTIYLPQVQGQPVTLRPLSELPAAVGRGSATILLVEDDRNVRETTRLVLEDSGYKVQVAASAEEGLDFFKRHHAEVDLVLSDVVMPGLGGMGLFEEMKQVSSSAKVLFVSGYSEDVVANHGVTDVGKHFLKKPFAIDALLRKVAVLLAERH